MTQPNLLPERLDALTLVASLREHPNTNDYVKRRAESLEEAVLNDRWLDATRYGTFWEAAMARYRLCVKAMQRIDELRYDEAQCLSLDRGTFLAQDASIDLRRIER